MSKIVHVITNFTELGGAENMLIKLVNACSEKHTQRIYSLMGVSGKMRQLLPYNVEVIALEASSAFALLSSTLKLRDAFYNSDIVYSWMYHANVVSALSKILSISNTPLIWGVRHSLDDYRSEKKSTKLAIQLGRLLKFVPKNTVYCSQRARAQHELLGYSCLEKSRFIPNGYAFPSIPIRDYSSKQNIIYGAAGRFHESKDYKTLISAVSPLLNNNAESQLHICGRGIDYTNELLLSFIDDEKIDRSQIKLLGEVTKIHEFYQEVDIFILSSKTEGFPNVLAEAAINGCTVFSTDVGDALSIINDESRIVPSGESKLMCDAIYRYLLLSEECKGKVNKSTIQHIHRLFAIDSIVKQYLALIDTD